MARVSCGVQCTTAVLFGLNLLFLLLGLTVMGLGIYVRVNESFSSVAELYSISEAFGHDAMKWVGITMIVIGVFSSILAAFGCLGALLHHRGFLYAYATILSLIVLIEFAAFITTLIYRSSLFTSYESGFLEVFNHAYEQKNTDAINIIENLERQFRCCGVQNVSDYVQNHFEIPLSCRPDQLLQNAPFSQGCAVAVTDWMWDQLPVIAGVLGTVLFIELFGIVSSLILGVAISHASSIEVYQKL